MQYSPRLPAHRALARAGAGAVVIGVLALHGYRPLGVLGQLTYLAFTVGGAVAAGIASRRLPRAQATPWRWVSAGLACSALGDAYWSAHEMLASPVPDVSVADPLWIASYVLLIHAMYLVLRDPGTGARDDLEGLLDSAVALLVAILLLWPTVLGPLLTDTTTHFATRLVWSTYPALDAALLAMIVRALITRRAGSWVGGLLVAGAALWLGSDTASNTSDLIGVTGVLADFGWMLGAALMGAAAWHASRQSRAASPADVGGDHARVPGRIGPVRITLSVAPLLVPAGIELWSNSRGTDASVILALGTVGMAALIGARTLLFLRTRDEAERRLRSSERYFMALAENSADAVLVLDAQGVIMNDSPHLAELLGHPGATIRGIPALSAVCAEDAATVAHLFARVLASPGSVFDIELRVEAEGRSNPWVAARAVNLLDDPDVRGIVINFHDITDRKTAEAELVHLAFHDSLTGLANRALFQDRVDHVVATGGLARAAILFLDLDGFKDVNDGFGHDAGDDLLRKVGDRLRHASRPGDTVARLGGDEFAILIEQANEPHANAIAVADRILDELSSPIMLEDGLITLSASIGVAVPEPGSTASSLLRDADVAMYEAKAAGRGRWVLYHPAMRTATVERLQLSQDLAVALEGEQLRVVYQPVVDLASGRVVGFEALLRWDHPDLGCIAPDRFIPLAEESGLIKPIGRWVLESACRTAVQWRERFGREDLTMAVNVSARQLASSDLVSHVEDALADSGLPASALVLEMTETVLVEDPIATAGRLRQLHRLGIRLAIDDFGTGYSSLSYLRQFPVDILKIDQSFVSSLTDAEGVPALIHGLVELGHTLGMELVAEGIETSPQLTHLRAEGCQLGQGYLFSPPVDAEAVDALLAGGAAFATPGPPQLDFDAPAVPAS